MSKVTYSLFFFALTFMLEAQESDKNNYNSNGLILQGALGGVANIESGRVRAIDISDFNLMFQAGFSFRKNFQLGTVSSFDIEGGVGYWNFYGRTPFRTIGVSEVIFFDTERYHSLASTLRAYYKTGLNNNMFGIGIAMSPLVILNYSSFQDYLTYPNLRPLSVNVAISSRWYFQGLLDSIEFSIGRSLRSLHNGQSSDRYYFILTGLNLKIL